MGRIVILGYVAATLLVVVSDAPTPVRAPLVIGFVAFIPGFVWTRRLGLGQPWVAVLFAIPVSLAITLLVATTALYVGAWHYELVLVFLATLTVFGVVLRSGTR